MRGLRPRGNPALGRVAPQGEKAAPFPLLLAPGQRAALDALAKRWDLPSAASAVRKLIDAAIAEAMEEWG